MTHILEVDNTISSRPLYTPHLINLLRGMSKVSVVSTTQELRSLLRRERIDGVVLTGSTRTITKHLDDDAHAMNKLALSLKVPVLGVCFGMQIMALVYGGIVASLRIPCKGPLVVTTRPSSLFYGGKFVALHDHGDHVKCVTHIRHCDHLIHFLDGADLRILVC